MAGAALRPGDECYLTAESEHVDRLQECNVRQLGLLLSDSSSGLGDWKMLAGRLGVSNEDVRHIEAMARDCGDAGRLVPGEEVLKVWRRKDRSTIRVLRQVLAGMKRDDVVTQLDYMRLSKYGSFTNFSGMLCVSVWGLQPSPEQADNWLLTTALYHRKK